MIRADSTNPGNIGAIVEVIDRNGAWSEFCGEWVWNAKTSRPLKNHWGELTMVGAIHDRVLTPLTPPPGTDMTDIYAEREDELAGLV